MDEQEIEKRIDRVVANDIAVSRTVGGVAISTMGEVFEMAKMIAVSGIAVPKHLRGSPGACLAICVQAFEWQLSPFAVANKSYSVNDRLAYESQLIHAVVEARAPLQKRLRDSYKGEGPTRQCTITGLLKGEDEPFEYTSPMLQDIKVKNSPLWVSDLDQQLFYYSSRAWARRYVPDVILGIYADDELAPGDGAVDITPQGSETTQRLAERLQTGKEGAAKGRGFDADAIDRVLEHKPGEVLNKPPVAGEKEPVVVTGKIEQPKAETGKRSHRKKPTTPAQDAVNGGGQGEGLGEATQIAMHGREAAEAQARAEVTRNESEPTPPPPAEKVVPVTQQELDQSEEEFPTESPGMANAIELLAKAEEAVKDLSTLDDLRAYKANMRKTIDALPDLTIDESDVLRGKFSTMMLTVERDMAKKGKRR